MTVPLFRSEQERYQRPDGITVVRRRAFARDFPYEWGDHVVFGGPTRRGKTSLAFDLLEFLATPDTPAFVAVPKPRDPVTEQRGNELGFRRVGEWPPSPKLGELKAFGGQKPPGYLVWSSFGDLTTDMERCADLTHTLLMERYSSGAGRKAKPGILVMDDTMVQAKIMRQDANMVTILAMAGAMKLGMWIFVQKPTDSGRTTTWGYEQAKHLFFTKGGDDRMLRRYMEILGEHGPIVKRVIPTLRPFEFLYHHRIEGYLCIVGAD